jgi:glycosyltransferase involved in cell wall biosynthesis
MLIPEIQRIFREQNNVPTQVIVVDDKSSDSTPMVMNLMMKKWPNIEYKIRESESSLPASILDGVKMAKGDLICWLDADGSMPILDVFRLYQVYSEGKYDVCIGSRYVKGGGFKGKNLSGRTTPLIFVKNLMGSEDSVLAVVLSRVLNIFLRFSIGAGIHDTTSGFILGDADVIRRLEIRGSYGDYFPRIVIQLKKNAVKMNEIGYICLPRFYGKSKTGTNLFQLIKRGIPYFNVGFVELLARFARLSR